MSGTAVRAAQRPGQRLLTAGTAMMALLAAAAHAAPPALTLYDSYADYGDAPDGTSARYPAPYQAVIGNFPTLRNTTNSRYGRQGGHCLTTSQEWLGVVVSRELDANDCTDPDGVTNLNDDDFDDALVNGPCAVGTPPAPFPNPMAVTLGIRVTVAPGAPNVTRYINVLIDHNHDGVWSNGVGAPEWAVVDMPVNVAPGTSAVVTTPPLMLPLSPVGCWTRIALTRTPVTGTFVDNGTGWDGSGRFLFGEIEDVLMDNALAYAQDADYAARSASDFAADAQFAFDWATDFEFDIDLAYDYAFDIELELAAVDMSVYVAAAQAQASAAAVSVASAASASATAQQYVYSIDNDCAAVAALSASMAAVCASCPCATACAHAGAVAAALAAACGSASASASAQAMSSADAYAYASAQASAIAVAIAQAQAHASAFAAAAAIAQAEAAAIAVALAEADAAAAAAAVAYADASAAASASASAAAAAYAAACGGDAQAAASAAASAHAYAAAAASAAAIARAEADASASAMAVAAAAARAIALAYADARVSASVSAQVATATSTMASAAAAASATAAASVTTNAHAHASSSAMVAALTGALAAASASCNGDCCPVITGSRKGNQKYKGTVATSSVRVAAAASSWTMVHVRVDPGTPPIQGFQWISLESNPGAFPGIGDWAIWDLPTVQSGMAFTGNALMSQQFVPAERQPLTTDCGNPVQLLGMMAHRNTIHVPPLTLPPGDYYVGVRLFTNQPSASSFIPVSHRDENAPVQPSYFQSAQMGYPQAVPIATVIGCDENVAIEALTHSSASPASSQISEKELADLMQLAEQLEESGALKGVSLKAAIGTVP